jgi:CheY-like chemotaxis protein
MPAVESCSICTRTVIPGEGAAFVLDHIVHVPCYVNGGHVQPPTLEPAISRDLLLGIHVLVVEDNDNTREMLREALEYCGAFVTTTTSATEGKALLRELSPRVIVSDISMPDDGFELIRDVLAFAVETGLRIPAVAITAGRDSRNHAREGGFAAFITKPLDPFVLAVVVERLAKARKTA